MTDELSLLEGEILPPAKVGNSGKRGGRTKGVPNKASQQNLKRAAEKSGLTPFEFFIEGLDRNRKMALKLFERAEKAKNPDFADYIKFDTQALAYGMAAAPYCHQRMAPKKQEPELPTIDLEGLSDYQLNVLIVRIANRLAGGPIEGNVGQGQSGSAGINPLPAVVR